MSIDHPVRRMTAQEETAYHTGSMNAQFGLPMNTAGMPKEERLAYERGYYNHAGETIDG